MFGKHTANIFKHAIPCQAVCNKININPIPNKLKDIEHLAKKF